MSSKNVPANETGAEGSLIERLKLLLSGDAAFCRTIVARAAIEQAIAILSRSPAMAAEAAPFEITEQVAAEWANRHDVDHVLKHFSTQRNAIEDARTLHLLAGALQPAQADARVGLTDRAGWATLEAVEWCIAHGNCGPRTRATLVAVRALLAAHPGQPKPRAEVTDDQIAAMFERVTGYSIENGRAALNDADILGFARELLEAARIGASS
ncbi:hypothetical protein [Burkholderia vietnamiensis]|uniref:hypothetical protein n=1 Tax=Burkholderia vietnamiensis TaxID=60552 RepID=UPI00159379C5|nr:hypothetical protein [Burkholderia vietnamiensis]MCA7943280.1 hypothetical protein [Burkholderia vietnamiensis]HDR8974005.1 hypothetical protein [Burkholderia vietnamiensis]HDR9142385.1 hypothetical protein [Burkholderia vietnamiensis]